MLTLGTVVLGAEDVRRAAGFWCEALGYVPRDGRVDEDWTVLLPADGRERGPGIALGASRTPVQEQPRVHLDLYARDAADQAAEVERLIALGAARVDWDLYPENPDFLVLADTEGNRFCVIDASRGN
ncbi:VOC family protein [Streptomyces sp. LX-29]|uniref:VOC family protein n=1 Tax=Streptomyces sp. LX-29 TaxID=2900152 RepID=UPI00240D6219|nr:VOC family protein [Streptomyces sp. LX-29]WFB06831.1 VOC family protein [Streptomyces sp. LX-29]